MNIKKIFTLLFLAANLQSMYAMERNLPFSSRFTNLSTVDKAMLPTGLVVGITVGLPLLYCGYDMHKQRSNGDYKSIGEAVKNATLAGGSIASCVALYCAYKLFIEK